MSKNQIFYREFLSLSPKQSFSLLLVIIFSISVLRAVDVQLPNLEANVGDSVTVSVSASGIQSEIFSLFSHIGFDPQVLEVIAVTNDSCRTEAWNDPIYNVTENGFVTISMFGTDSLSADGDLFRIEFDVIALSDTTSDLLFQDFMFNEGTPSVSLTDGQITVIDRYPSINPVADQNVVEGDMIGFFVIADDPFDLNLTIEAFNLPDSANLTDYGNGFAHFSWQTDQLSQGEYEIGFIATNEDSLNDTLLVNISVENVLNVRLPELDIPLADSVIVPVYTDEVGLLDIYSLYAKITFDETVLDPVSVIRNGTVSEDWGTMNTNFENPGEILISMFATESLAGNGTLFEIDYDIIGGEGSSSDLDFEFFLFNDGNPEAGLTNGNIFIGTPVAEFAADVISGYSPLTVQFTDHSIAGPIPIVEWYWDFGDGEFSNEQNPVHTFYETGNYIVSLTVTNENDSIDTEVKNDYIEVFPITADFITDETDGYYPAFEVNFTDRSSGNITFWSWDFQNDGIIDSYEQNPTFTYTEAGIYSVKLEIDDGVNSDSIIREDLITVVYAPPSAPDSIRIDLIGNDAVLSWQEVTTTIHDTPLEVDYYLIYASYLPYQNFMYIGYTSEPDYTHPGVVLFESSMFYKVKAFIGTRQEIRKFHGENFDSNIPINKYFGIMERK